MKILLLISSLLFISNLALANSVPVPFVTCSHVNGYVIDALSLTMTTDKKGREIVQANLEFLDETKSVYTKRLNHQEVVMAVFSNKIQLKLRSKTATPSRVTVFIDDDTVAVYGKDFDVLGGFTCQWVR